MQYKYMFAYDGFRPFPFLLRNVFPAVNTTSESKQNIDR